MEDKLKGFWKFFILLVAGAAVNLAGALIGKNILGYILYGLGLVIVVGGAVWVFLKTEYFKGNHLRVLVAGLLLGILLAGGAALLLGGSSSSASGMTPPSGFTGQMNGAPSSQGGTGSSNGGTMPSGNMPSGNASGQMPSGNFSGTSGSSNWSSSGRTSGSRPGSASNGAAKIAGWIILGLGLASVAFIGILLLTKKLIAKEQPWKILLLGFLVGALLSAGVVMMFVKSASAGAVPQMSQNGALPQASATAEATETATEATATATPAATSTPKPTSTATTATYSSLVVCLNYDVQIGANIRTFPSDTGTNVGTIPAAGCFTVDGKNSQYDGWYHMASGQDGYGGISIWSKADSDNLWVKGDNFSISADKLAGLPEVEVTATK